MHYLISTELSVERCNDAASAIWGDENGLHRRLNVVVNDDQDWTRMGYGPPLALDVMQKDGSKDFLREMFQRAD